MLSPWSALNPGVWVIPGTSQKGTYTIRPAVLVDRNTDFRTFSTFETTSQLGYTYPEFNELDIGNPDIVRNSIGHIVNQLCGTKLFSSLTRLVVNAAGEEGASKGEQDSSLTGIPAESHHVPTAQVPEGSLPAKGYGGEYPIPHQQPSTIPNLGPWDWTARIQAKHNELGQSFTVLLFLGNVPEDPTDWMTSSNYIGGYYAYVTSMAERGPRRAEHERLQEGFVHLNHSIVEHSRLTSLDPNVVEPYLTRNLQWRVQKADRTVADLESLEVTVIATQLTYPPGAMFPVPGEIRRYNGITHGKRGGSRHA